jgi:hypothetical protein
MAEETRKGAGKSIRREEAISKPVFAGQGYSQRKMYRIFNMLRTFKESAWK